MTVFVINLVQDDSYMAIVDTWTPLEGQSGSFTGTTSEPDWLIDS